VVSPDNRSRMEINERIHAELQGRGVVSGEEHRVKTLVPRQELTGADRTWACLLYTSGSGNCGRQPWNPDAAFASGTAGRLERPATGAG